MPAVDEVHQTLNVLDSTSRERFVPKTRPVERVRMILPACVLWYHNDAVNWTDPGSHCYGDDQMMQLEDQM